MLVFLAYFALESEDGYISGFKCTGLLSLGPYILPIFIGTPGAF